MKILGLSAFYHDSAAALLIDGKVIAAAQEERFSRKKHDASFPRRAVEYCLSAGRTKLRDIDHVVFYDKPFLKFERLLETYVAFAPSGFKSFRLSLPLWVRDKLFQKNALVRSLREMDPEFDAVSRLLFTEHHQSHAASAFFPSPFDEAMVLTMDGVGEWATATIAHGRGNSLQIQQELHFPHSLGLLYSAFTYHLGFKVNSGEYKVMGLAPYGEPRYAQLILDSLIDLKKDGSFWLDQDYFDYCTGLTMTSPKMDALLGGAPRRPEEQLTQRHMDLAASIQAVTEEVVQRMTRSIAQVTGVRNLCLAGGVALNCVANSRILRDASFERIWIQPAAGDAGGALGAALAAHYQYLDSPRVAEPGDGMEGAYLGPEYSQDEVESRLSAVGARYEVLEEREVIEIAARALANGKVVGWFQGRMEFGPRALGNRSILADPRAADMQRTLNLKIKYRESFRPFAPSVLGEDVSDWFDLEVDSPYMLLVADVLADHRRATTEAEDGLFGIDRLNVQRSSIPAVTHVDYSARVQSVHRSTNPRYHALISKFKELTGCPVLVNTSFNVRGEPIVCTPENAFQCFMGTEMDLLIVGNCLARKHDQRTSLMRDDYVHEFEAD